jgi:hypothetical protein
MRALAQTSCCLTVIACSARALPPAAPPPSTSSATPARGGCSDVTERPAAAPSPAFRAAHDRLAAGSAWGKGFGHLELPAGFVDTNAPREGLVDINDADEDPAARWSGYLDEGGPDRLHLWVYDASEREGPPWDAAAWVLVYPMPDARPASLFLHAVRTLEVTAGGPGLAPDTTSDQVENWFNFHGELQDDGGRRIVEWAYVEKGCERAERYERILDTGATMVRMVLVVEGGADDATLADWTARFFDAPLALPRYEGRRSLAFERTPR